MRTAEWLKLKKDGSEAIEPAVFFLRVYGKFASLMKAQAWGNNDLNLNPSA